MRAVALASLTAFAAACRGPFPQSTLAPRSDFAAAIDHLFTGIFWWAVAVFVVVEGLLLYAVIRYRARPGSPEAKPIHGHTLLEVGWTLAPAVILVFIAVPTMSTIFRTSGRAPPGALQVEVVGHQWWWEFRYPALGIVTANELHLPVGRPVALAMTTADVIHSFWVPALGGKRDVTGGRTTHLVLTPDSVATYPGQCAEFCGASHANMRLRVHVEAARDFDAWVVRRQAPPAAPPPGSLAARGREVFGRSACIACHTVAGVETAQGTVGPNLTRFAERTTVGAGLFAHTADTLRLWIANAPALKPGVLMPAMDLPAEDLDAIVAFLRTGP
jgi:cytochrome c oxidase subunit 2